MRHPEATRRQAAALFAVGTSRAEVARQLRIARSTSSAWYRRWCDGALLDEGRRGRRPRLTAAQRTKIGRALLRPPTAHGIEAASWSLRAIALLIERETGARFHHRHVSRLVTRMGWLVPPVERYAQAARFAHPVDTPDVPVNLLLTPRTREA